MKCWYCGVEPDRLFDVTSLNSAEPEYLPNWPVGDHEHAERPPTPGQMQAAGAAAFDRIIAAW